jgi:hypothetical protein
MLLKRLHAVERLDCFSVNGLGTRKLHEPLDSRESLFNQPSECQLEVNDQGIATPACKPTAECSRDVQQGCLA